MGASFRTTDYEARPTVRPRADYTTAPRRPAQGKGRHRNFGPILLRPHVTRKRPNRDRTAMAVA